MGFNKIGAAGMEPLAKSLAALPALVVLTLRSGLGLGLVVVLTLRSGLGLELGLLC